MASAKQPSSPSDRPQRERCVFVAILSILALSPSLAHAQQPADACDRLPKLTVPEQDKPTLPEALALVVPLPRPPANEPLPATANLQLRATP